jgi:hypothetical protein
MLNLTPNTLDVVLRAKSRDELNVVARRLSIVGYRRLSKSELISEILALGPSRVAHYLELGWWDRFHNHVYGGASVVGLILAIAFYMLQSGHGQFLSQQSGTAARSVSQAPPVSSESRRASLFRSIDLQPDRWRSILITTFESRAISFKEITPLFADELCSAINKKQNKEASSFSDIYAANIYGTLLAKTHDANDLLWLVDQALATNGSVKLAYNAVSSAGRSNPVFESEQVWLSVLQRIPTPISQMNTGMLPHVFAHIDRSNRALRDFLLKAYVPPDEPIPTNVGWGEYSGNEGAIVQSIHDAIGCKRFIAEFLHRCQFVRMRMIAFQTVLSAKDCAGHGIRHEAIEALADTLELYAYWDGWIESWGDESTVNHLVAEIRPALGSEDLKLLRQNLHGKRNATYLLQALDAKVKTAKDDPGVAFRRALQELGNGMR